MTNRFEPLAALSSRLWIWLRYQALPHAGKAREDSDSGAGIPFMSLGSHPLSLSLTPSQRIPVLRIAIFDQVVVRGASEEEWSQEPGDTSWVSSSVLQLESYTNARAENTRLTCWTSVEGHRRVVSEEGRES